MDNNELLKVLENHKEWLKTKGMSGIRADFTKYLGKTYWTDDDRCIIIEGKKFDLDGIELNDCDLSEATLSLISLQSANLSGARLYKANLRGANFLNANLTGTQLQGTNLQTANLTGVIAINTSFKYADLENATLQNVDLHSSEILGANLKKTNLRGACLDDLNLSKMNFQGANLTGASLIRTNLSDANLSEAIMDGCSMQGAILDHANLEKASLVNTNLEFASLQDANLRLARLEGSQFARAKLDGASFQRASLCGAVFKSANLVAVNFRGANLEGVDFSGDTILHYAKFDNAEEMVKTGKYKPDGTEIEDKQIFFTKINDINWKGADATSITISKSSISMLPKHITDSYGETFNVHIPQNNTIIHSIEFPRGYEQAGLGILSYFNKVVHQKYKNIKVQVSITQNDHRITMVIETPEGAKEIIEETLYNYGLVVSGKLEPESFLEDKFEILELKHQLTFLNAQLESSRELSKFKDEHYGNEIAFMRQFMTMTQKSSSPQISFNPSFSIEANSMSEKKTKTEQRQIFTGGGHYIEGDYNINMNQSLDVASHEIRALVDKLLKEGMTSEAAQTHIAEELSSQAKRDKSVREKLLQWAEELTKSTVSDIAKNVVKTAIRLAGIPLP